MSYTIIPISHDEVVPELAHATEGLCVFQGVESMEMPFRFPEVRPDFFFALDDPVLRHINRVQIDCKDDEAARVPHAEEIVCFEISVAMFLNGYLKPHLNNYGW